MGRSKIRTLGELSICVNEAMKLYQGYFLQAFSIREVHNSEARIVPEPKREAETPGRTESSGNSFQGYSVTGERGECDGPG